MDKEKVFAHVTRAMVSIVQARVNCYDNDLDVDMTEGEIEIWDNLKAIYDNLINLRGSL